MSDYAALVASDLRAASYGVRMDGPGSAENAATRAAVNADGGETVYWTCKDLKEVTVLRLIGASREYPWWDFSYAYGVLKDGTNVRVDMPIGFGNLGRFSWKRDLIALAKREGVFAKGLGLLDDDRVSRLHG